MITTIAELRDQLVVHCTIESDVSTNKSAMLEERSRQTKLGWGLAALKLVPSFP